MALILKTELQNTLT